jgi:hypothetical protein
LPGYLPGALGITAFAAIKFGGYSLAAITLKAREKTIDASVVRIAGARTLLGFVLGPFATIGSAYLLDAMVSRSEAKYVDYSVYGLLVIARIFIWALVLFFSLEKHRSKDPSFGCIRWLAQSGPVYSTCRVSP